MKTLGIIIGILALLAFVPLVHAEQENQNTFAEPILIAQPVNETANDLNESDASGFKPFMQELRAAFEFNQEKRLHLEIELARLRLIQAKIAAKHNDSAAVENAINAHNRIMERVRAKINEISNKGGNVTGLNRAIQVHELKIAKLNAILASENLTTKQIAKIEARIEHVENVTEKLKALQAKIQESEQNKSQEQGQKQVQSCSANKTNETIVAKPTCGCNKK